MQNNNNDYINFFENQKMAIEHSLNNPAVKFDNPETLRNMLERMKVYIEINKAIGPKEMQLNKEMAERLKNFTIEKLNSLHHTINKELMTSKYDVRQSALQQIMEEVGQKMELKNNDEKAFVNNLLNGITFKTHDNISSEVNTKKFVDLIKSKIEQSQGNQRS